MANKVEHYKPIFITTKENCENKALHNRQFTLDFSRESVARAEDFGFRLEEIDTKVVTMTLKIFYFSFYMHHKDITMSDAEDIFDNELHGLTEEEFDRLLMLFVQGFETLTYNEDSVDEEVKNSRATVIL